MVVAMLLAHLVGDFILQWNGLAYWKSRDLKGVIVHSLIVAIVTAAAALLFEPFWWQGVLFISATHFVIDAAQFYIRLPVSAMARFLIDQVLHLTFIFAALIAGGYLHPTLETAVYGSMLQQDKTWVLLLGYAFLTMPAWVLLNFLSYHLICGKAPDFHGGKDKYLSMLERLLMATLVLLGQFLLVPLVAVPRLILYWPQLRQLERRQLYVVELLASVTTAVVVGVGLRLLI